MLQCKLIKKKYFYWLMCIKSQCTRLLNWLQSLALLLEGCCKYVSMVTLAFSS